jgi:hypothetical protein
MLTAKIFVIASLALSAVHALKVPPGSPCATVCGNVQDRTNKTDIVCEQSEYATTDAGKMFEDCLSCMSTSTYTDDGQNTDLQWMLCRFHYSHPSHHLLTLVPMQIICDMLFRTASSAILTTGRMSGVHLA